MLFNIISNISSDVPSAIISAVFLIVVVLFSLTVHEYAHGFVAYKLGDPTAKAMGRLSLNPRYHLDPFGALMMLIFGFGWAKPVPVNPAYFKNRKLGMAITAFAGPVSNLLLAFIGVICYTAISAYYIQLFSVFNALTVSLLYQFFSVFFVPLNISLAVFNLLPIPPLDGSRILNIVLPERYYFKVMQYERYIYFAVIILLFTGILDRPLNFICYNITAFFESVISLIPFLRI